MEDKWGKKDEILWRFGSTISELELIAKELKQGYWPNSASIIRLAAERLREVLKEVEQWKTDDEILAEIYWKTCVTENTSAEEEKDE